MLILALFQTYHLVMLANHLMLEGEETDFGGLGKMMLGGFLLAIAVAVAITLVRLRLRDKKPPAQFISITAFQKKD
jgi:hypothetical protein